MGTHSIFEPRQSFDKNGVAVSYVSPVGIKEYDKYYINYIVKQVPVPLGESDDYVLEMRVIEDKQSIKAIIDSQVGDVGLEAMLEKFNRTGDPSVLPSPVQATEQVQDFTKVPQDSAEYFSYVHGLAAAFESLPIELRKDLTMEAFIKQVTDKQVNDYLDSVKPKVKEEKNNE